MSVRPFVDTPSFTAVDILPDATTMQSMVTKVEAYIQYHLPRYIHELSNLCAIDSPSYYKPGLDDMALCFGKRMSELGMQVRILQHEQYGNDVHAILHGNGKGKVLLLGHTDTVFPVGIATARRVRVEDDMVYGPGVSDMKGCILSAIYALEAMIELNYSAFGEVHFLCVSDEEINTRHSKETIQQISQECQGVFVLESARANGDIVSARKGGTWYTLTATGHSAHAGVEPEKGRSAILELAHQIVQFQSLNNYRDGVTINTGVVAGGTVVNVVPDYAEVQLDLRYYHPDDRLAIEKQWHEMMENKLVPDVLLKLETKPDSRAPMGFTQENLKLAHKAQDIASWLGFPLNHTSTGGISDANYTSGNGLPTLDGLGPIGGLDHSPNEYLLASSVAPRAALLAGLIAHAGA